ncbi:hypothetical protein ACG7TL_009061 [Trametes sanguinea]
MSDRPLSTLSSLAPPVLSALAGAGYETVQDLLSNSTPEQLSKDLNIPLPASQAVFSAAAGPSQRSLPMTQSAAAMMGTTAKQYSTACPPLDRLLGGGLKRGFILEINGPPGSGKEQMAATAVRTFVECDQQVLFVDMQNMVLPATIKRILMNSPTAEPDGMDLVRYLAFHTTAEFVAFVRSLPAYLEANPSVSRPTIAADIVFTPPRCDCDPILLQTALLVLNSLAFPFQPHTIKRFAILDKLKQVLARACASMGLTVIITSQLTTKMLEGNGQPGSAPPGSKSVMIPSFRDSDFPPGRTYRVIIVPLTRTTGVIRLLSSPTHVPSRGQPAREEPYQGSPLHEPAHHSSPRRSGA